MSTLDLTVPAGERFPIEGFTKEEPLRSVAFEYLRVRTGYTEEQIVAVWLVQGMANYWSAVEVMVDGAVQTIHLERLTEAPDRKYAEAVIAKWKRTR